MNVYNPTADDLLLLGAAQRNNQKRLDKLQRFTIEEAEQALLNCHVWLEEEQDWAVSVTHLANLAFDTRMPSDYIRFNINYLLHLKAIRFTAPIATWFW